MKKAYVTVVVIVVVVFLFAGLLIWNLTDCATLCGSRSIEMSWEDTEQLRELLQVREIHFEGAACGFRDDDAVKIGCLTYCFARDDCNTIYIKELDLYYSIADRGKLDELLSKYQ